MANHLLVLPEWPVNRAVFHIPDDPGTIPVNEHTKPDKWVVELILDYLKKREKEKPRDAARS